MPPLFGQVYARGLPSITVRRFGVQSQIRLEFNTPNYIPNNLNTAAHLVSGKSHKLFGRSFPDSGYSDDPAYIIVDDGGGRLVAELLQRVLVEEPQRVTEHRQCRVRSTIGCLDRRLFVEILQSTNAFISYRR